MKRATLGIGSGLFFLGAAGWLIVNGPGTAAEAQTTQTPDKVKPGIWPPHPIPPRPRPPRPVLDQELQLVTQSARVDIRAGFAKTKLTQTFQNTTNRTIEGTYVLPLPEGAAVTNFAMMVNGKRVEAEILEGEKAREIYTGIVQKMRDPAILEFIDRNLIRARIFPISPRAEQKVELEYTETLKPESGSFRYAIPLKLPTGGAARSTAIEINIESPDGIRAVYSPTHDVEVKRDGNKARISGEFGLNDASTAYSANRPKPKDGAARDFVLYYTADKQRIGVNLMTYKEPGEDSYFMLLAAPDPQIAKQEVAAKDVVFVCDTSGSMGGAKIEQARKALLTILGNLNPNDRFNVITFSSDTRSFRDELTPASKINIDAARDWVGGIKAVGGTNINEALSESLKLMSKGTQLTGARPQQIVFMTDGQPTVGETNIENILKNIRSANEAKQPRVSTSEGINFYEEVAARLFVFGVGYDVNTRLLDSLAEENKGSSDYVLPEEDIEQKVGSLYGKIAYPVLTNTRLEWKGRSVYDVYPKQLPDLFRGGQVVVFGRIADDVLYKRASAAPPASVELTGWSEGKEQRIVGAGDFRSDSGNDVLPRLWAMRKVGYLLDDARRSGRTVDNEVKDEIIKLSKKFGIVTPFTAGLITEDEQPSTQPAQRETWANPAGPTAAQDMAAVGNLFRSKNVTGRGAVTASKATTAMRETSTLREDARLDSVRYLEGKTFTLKDDMWVDNAYDAAKSPKLQIIKFASPEYFELLKVRGMAKWLSVGDKVIVTFLNRAVQIEP